MKNYTFKTRNEVINFLESYNFKYYVPRLEEKMDALRDNDKMYYVEITDNNKVNYCSICRRENNAYSINEVPFYNCNKAYNSLTTEQGEDSYKEFLEYKEYNRKIENEILGI